MQDVTTLEQVTHAGTAVIVDVWAPWCAPCRQMTPLIEQLASEYAGRVTVIKINADEHLDLARQLHVSSIPTLLAYRQGQEVLRRSGAQSRAMLVEIFEAVAAGSPLKAGRIHSPDRWLRLFTSLALLVLAIINGFSPLLLLAAGIVFFSAVHDRCPLWQAIRPRLQAAIKTRSAG